MKRRPIIGVTVGTPMNPALMDKYIENGKSAYELAVKNGFEGTEEEWLESLHGVDGRDGVDGYTPVKGIDYFDGKDGKDGVNGKDGSDGYTPIKGKDYFDGVDGKDGYTPIKGVDYFDGKDGKDGVDGKDGYTPVKGKDYFDGVDGRDGIAGKDGYTPVKGVDYFDGQPGKDGYTPIKGVDYFDGQDGDDAISPTVSVEEIEGGHRIIVTDKDGAQEFNVMDGTLASSEIAAVIDDVKADVAKKVDKVSGKSLVDDDEIARLANVHNYDDTKIKEDISKKADSSSVNTELSKKVDKADGHSLVSDAEIARLNNVDNYNDAELRELIDGNAKSVNDIENYVGKFIHSTAKTVVEYVNAKTDGIATSGNLEALSERLTAVEGDVSIIKEDYVKPDDISNFETKDNVKKVADDLASYVESNDTAVAAEKKRAEDIEGVLRTDVDSVTNRVTISEGKITNLEKETVKHAAKTEVENALALKADKSVVDTMYTNAQIDNLIAATKKYADDNDENTQYGIEYDPISQKIKLTNNTSKTEIDATAFIKDGMIESVALSDDGLHLVITWNTDAGKGENNTTTIPLTGLVDVYTGVDGTTVSVSVSSDDKISAEVKSGSIKNSHIASDAAIAKSKLSSDVQSSLNKADSALQTHQDISHLATKNEVQGVDTKFSNYTTTTNLNTALSLKADKTQVTTDISSAVKVETDRATGVENSLASRIKDIEDNKAGYATTSNVATAKGEAIATAEEKAELLDAALKSEIDADVSKLQTAINGKADASHGTHVEFDTTNKPKVDGTAAFGTSAKVARADHVHPTDTSRASKSDFDGHTSNTTLHITSTERSTWNAKANSSDIPTKVSQLTNDSGYLTSVPVTKVNNKTGAVTLTASDVGADASGTASNTVSAHNASATAHADIRAAIPTVPTKVSAFTNDAGYLTQHQSLAGLATTKEVEQLSTEVAYIDLTDNESIEIEIESAKEELKEYINGTITTELAKRGQLKPEFAQSEEWLAENGDKSKMYVLPDGFIYAWMQTTGVGGSAYTNKLPAAEKGGDQTGTWVEGGGYSTNMRLSGSGGNAATATNANFVMCASGYIPAKVGDVVRIKNFYSPDGIAGYAISYDVSKVKLSSKQWSVSDLSSTYPWISGDWYTVEGSEPYATSYKNITKFEVTSANFGSEVAFIRFSGIITSDTIITINEEIVEEGVSTIVEKWASTGHAFVPADYDDEIATLKYIADVHTAEIDNLYNKVLKVQNGISDTTEEEALERIKKWDKPVYDYSPVTLLTTERAKPALTASDRTVSAVYAKYRALMAKHPRYITETNLGKSTASATFQAVDILRFDFKEPDGLVQSSSYTVNETKPKIILMCGVHCEYAGIYGVYYALEEIAENPEFDDIRRNAHIIVVPCSNPFGLTSQAQIDDWQMSHVNANGVAIHNNFGVEYNTYNKDVPLGSANYGGTEAYSELETQYIDKLMSENTDAIAFVTCHNFNNDLVFGSMAIWASSATAYMCNLSFRLIDKISKSWHNKYGSALQDGIDTYKNENLPDGETRLGYAQFSTSAGTEQLNATKYGIQATNLEISDNMRAFTNAQFSADVMTRGAEVYANFFRTILAAYDHKDKKEYAPNLPWSE